MPIYTFIRNECTFFSMYLICVCMKKYSLIPDSNLEEIHTESVSFKN